MLIELLNGNDQQDWIKVKKGVEEDNADIVEF